MFRIRKPTILSALYLQLVVALIVGLGCYYPASSQPMYSPLVLWLLPPALAHCIRRRWVLFWSCLFIHVALYCSPSIIPDSIWQRDAWMPLHDIDWALTLPTGMLRFRGMWFEWAVRMPISALAYGLVGLVYTRTCVRVAIGEGSPTVEPPLGEVFFSFVRRHRRALLIVVPPLTAIYCIELSLYWARQAEINRLVDLTWRGSNSCTGDERSLPDVPLHGLRRLLGIDHSWAFTSLDIAGDCIDADIETLRPFRYLEQVRIADHQITERSLALLGELPRLRALDLSGTTDAGLMRLKNLNNLTYLSLSNTKISDEGFIVISQAQNLRYLHLRNEIYDDETKAARPGRFSEQSIRRLAKIKTLESLIVVDNGLTDECLRELAALPNLQWLEIGSIQLSGTGFAHLAQANQLKGFRYETPIRLSESPGRCPAPPQLNRLIFRNEINLDECFFLSNWLEQATLICARNSKDYLAAVWAQSRKVTELDMSGSSFEDDEVEFLTGLQQLTRLNLEWTNVTEKGVAELQKKLPKCEILYGDSLLGLRLESGLSTRPD